MECSGIWWDLIDMMDHFIVYFTNNMGFVQTWECKQRFYGDVDCQSTMRFWGNCRKQPAQIQMGPRALESNRCILDCLPTPW